MLSFDDWFSSTHATIPVTSARAVLSLAQGGATLPFIARYRKEQTGNLDEVAIQSVLEARETWDAVEHRKKFICAEIERQGKLTPELKEKILATYELERLEDFYLPFKLKRKTRAMTARESGLEPLAEWMWRVSHHDTAEHLSLGEKASAFLSPDKGIATTEQAIEGARDIVVERLSEDAHLRERVRKALFDQGFVRSRKGERARPNSKYERYFSHHERVSALLRPEASHRYLAMRRGLMEEELVLSVGGAPEDESFDAQLVAAFERVACSRRSSPAAEVMTRAARLSLRAYIQPSIENEVHRALREAADVAAIHVFAENLRKLLLASPYGARSVLGVDPGLRTGCKLAVVSESGAYLGSHVIHLGSDPERAAAREVLRLVVANASVSAVAVGNGTAGRETEAFIRGALGELGLGRVPVVMVSEAGASVYSASDVAREEFPDLDLTIRGAISIARRLQDPLAELVKVDPKSIGVGQYQHDVTPGRLKRSLETVVESCVSSVGVNVNTASPYLLAEVAGIGASLARAIAEHRRQKGVFKAKRDLLSVARFSETVFEQAAGFLRIPGAAHPLDNTGIHPERYPLLERLASRLGKKVGDLVGPGASLVKSDTQFRSEVGEFTFDDIVMELERPGRDPRESFVVWSFRADIHRLADLVPGMTCPGIVTNVTNFGAFVDIGVHQDGLVHVSQLADRFVKDPREVVNPGDRVTVRVVEVNLGKSQIALTMRSAADAARPQGRPDPARPQGKDARDGARAASVQISPGALKNDALKQLEQFRAALKRNPTGGS
jgi:protein Tex